jgi:MFS transporter, ACS family, hexuronate transporter
MGDDPNHISPNQELPSLTDEPCSLSSDAHRNFYASLDQHSQLASKASENSIGRRRWMICGLLFFAATVNYVDRQVIGLLKPLLQLQLGWTETGYSNIVIAFQFAYAAGMLFAGKLIDRIGTRRGFSIAVSLWSLAAMAHAAASSIFQFAVARFSLGIGEAGSFPASIKAVAEWFPKRERALATGLFNSGTNIGAIAAPLMVPWLTYRFGWRMAFIGTGALGLVWIICWLALYSRPEEDRKLSAAELAYIKSDTASEQPTDPTIPWLQLIRIRSTWGVALAKFFTDPIWYVFLFWMPDFLNRNLGLNLNGMRLPLIIIYSGASVGSITGGWLSSSLLKRGWSLNASRKTAMLVCAVAVTPIMISARTTNAWLAVWLVALAAGAHQGWSANIYTLVSDIFPRGAVASVVGFASTVGAIGGMLVSKAVGYILQATGSYVPVFLMAGLAYLVGLGFVQLLIPRISQHHGA